MGSATGYTPVCDTLLHSAKGRDLKALQEVLAFVALATSAIAAVWGAVCWLRAIPSTAFWPVLRISQAAVVLLAVATGVLLASDSDALDGLEIFYALMPVGVNAFAEGARVNAAASEMDDVEDLEALERREQVLLARRIVLKEIGVMTIASLLSTTLLLRATGLF